MGILNPVVSKFTLTAGVPQEVYICPSSKTYSIIDLTFFKDNLNGDALIAAALSTESNPNNLTSTDYFIDDIQMTGAANSAELSKVIVGSGERLYIKVVSGVDIVVRLTGVEENNPKVLKAGRLAASKISNTNQTQIYSNTFSNVSYIATSITIFNTSTTQNAQVEVWISTSNTPSSSDKILKLDVPFEDTAILENILLLPNEKIFVKSSIANTEYFINGTIVSN